MSSRKEMARSDRNAVLLTWPRAVLPALICAAVISGAHAAAAPAAAAASGSADPVIFDSSFLPGSAAGRLDLSRFQQQDYVPPGTYYGNIVVNSEWRARGNIVFANVTGTDASQPCYDVAALVRYGVDVGKIQADLTRHPAKAMPSGSFCGDIAQYIPDASASFDPSEQSLSLSVPQIYMSHNARGYVDPSQWDAGINAGVLNYTSNFYRSDFNGRGGATGYLGLNGSLKFGSWHVYHLGSLSWSQGYGTHYQASASYLQHDLPEWSSQLVLGDAFTTGEMFDSVSVRGVRLYSDVQMLPQSQRGYAPTIHGVAETNAHVVVRQQGIIIYDANVPAGPFVIDDLYPTGYGGDLNVEITEADGRIRRFTQPYSSVPLLLRPGQQLWDAAVGTINRIGLSKQPFMSQLTYQRGLSDLFTGYGGVIFADGYQSILAGTAANTPVGAVSFDSTYSQNALVGEKTDHGYSLRVGYSKAISDFGTNVNVSAYRYSSAGYVSLADAVELRAAQRFGNQALVARSKSRMSVNLNQPLGKEYGQLYLTGSWNNYWNGSRQVDFSAGYSNHWKRLSYSLSAQRTSDTSGLMGAGDLLVDHIPGALDGYLASGSYRTVRDTRIFLTLTLPLGSERTSPTLSASMNHAGIGGDNQQVSINGSADKDGRFTYGGSLNHSQGTNMALSGQYNAMYANLAGSYGTGNAYRQAGLGISGSVVGHSGGVLFSPPTGDTFGIVEAHGAEGAKVGSSANSYVNGQGYAVVPYLMAYQLNSVELDPKGTDVNVELKDTMQQVAPRQGSVVKLRYEADTRRMLLIDAKLSDGNLVPFGAEVLDQQGVNVGVVGQGGRLVVKGVEGNQTLTVRWGGDEGQQCKVKIAVPAVSRDVNAPLQVLKSMCEK